MPPYALGPFKFRKPPEGAEFEMILTPANFVDLCTVALAGNPNFLGDDFQVDWGDGNFIGYEFSTFVQAVPTGNITVRASLQLGHGEVTNIFDNVISRTYTAVNIVRADHITDLDLCFNNSAVLESFTCASLPLCTQMTSTLSNCPALVSVTIASQPVCLGISGLFQNCTALTTAGISMGSFPVLDFIMSTWAGCTALTTMPDLDLSTARFCSSAWEGSGLTSVPDNLDLSAAETLIKAWKNCESLTSFPTIIAPSCTIFTSAWESSGLVSFADNHFIIGSTASNFTDAFFACASLVSVGALTFTKTAGAIALANRLFGACTSLVCIAEINGAHITGTNMFALCTSLVAPDSTDQNLIENFALHYINPGACPP